jgi:hypothetical protein
MPLGRQLHSSSDCIVVIVTPVVVSIMGISAVVARVEGVREMGVAKISSVIWCIWWRGISGKVCKGVASSNRSVWPAEPPLGTVWAQQWVQERLPMATLTVKKLSTAFVVDSHCSCSVSK